MARYGTLLASQHKDLQDTLLRQLTHSRPAVRKRAIAALGVCVCTCVVECVPVCVCVCVCLRVGRYAKRKAGRRGLCVCVWGGGGGGV